jgi:hypothetical protein
VVPEPDEGRPKSLALRGRDHRRCKRPENVTDYPTSKIRKY